MIKRSNFLVCESKNAVLSFFGKVMNSTLRDALCTVIQCG